MSYLGLPAASHSDAISFKLHNEVSRVVEENEIFFSEDATRNIASKVQSLSRSLLLFP